MPVATGTPANGPAAMRPATESGSQSGGKTDVRARQKPEDRGRIDKLGADKPHGGKRVGDGPTGQPGDHPVLGKHHM